MEYETTTKCKLTKDEIEAIRKVANIECEGIRCVDCPLHVRYDIRYDGRCSTSCAAIFLFRSFGHMWM